MSLFKPAARLTLAAIIGLSPLQLMAQANPMAAIQGVQGTLGIQAGNYTFQSYDKGELQKLVLNQMKEAQAADAEYVLLVAGQVEIMANGLIRDINGDGGIQKITDEAYAKGQRVDLGALLQAYRAYNVGMTEVQNKLASIQALPSAMKQDEPVSLEGSGIVQLRNRGVVDLSKTIDFYNSQLKAIEKQVNAISINTYLPNKKAVINTSLKDLMAMMAKTPPYSPEEIQQKKTEEVVKRNLGTERRQQLGQHFLKTTKLVQQYIQDFGTNQRYRLNTTPEARKDILEELNMAFWSRSLLRATYGVKLGALGIEFKTQTFNREYIFASNQITFHANPILKQEDINSQRRTLLIALGVLDKRDDKLLAAETPFFNRILSGIAFVKGEAQLAQVNVEILKLIYADMEEEGILATQGFNGMRRHYQSRWYTGLNGEQVAEIRARSKDWRNQDMVDMDVIRGVFFAAAKTLESYLVQLDEAEQLKAEIALFENNSDIIKKYKNAADDL